MARLQFSAKRVQIDKANLTILIVMSVACFVTIFSLVAAKSLLDQRAYQSRVIEKKEKARDQLKANLAARDELVSQYKVFVENQVNMISGSSSGKGAKDGDNAKLVLDALPSKYDFPAVATSLEKLIADAKLAVKSISGTDNEVEQGAAVGDSAVPVEMPFEATAEGSSDQLQALLTSLEHSIRPFGIQKLTITAASGKLSTTINGLTYYQPEKLLTIKEEIVR